jgi:hypothetical protein
MSSFYFPPFNRLHVRRALAKLRTGFDTMRVHDCWLAAELADAQTELEVCDAGTIDWNTLPSRWLINFNLVRKGLNLAGWRANIDHYLKPD